MEASQSRSEQEMGPAQQTAEQAPEKVGEATEQAKQTAQNVASQAQDRIREQVDQRSTEIGERVGGTAQDVRSVSEELRNQGKEGPAKVADQAADRIERAGSYLRDSDADRILNDVEDFGRSRPWAVLAGGVVVGIVAARFLKASSERRYSDRQRAGYSHGAGGRELSAPRAPATGTAGTTPSTPETTPVGVR
ncbi:MAG TPA: hypothetical protein VKA41_11405 [Solirubrobacterales bacterium]|nr:hypothetical protein [Solirubrobacterales bacterium]